ncbi:hypothetical protein Hdeb2414_s0016g00492581 [Helianthus debilis subsp. tardiflorus]
MQGPRSLPLLFDWSPVPLSLCCFPLQVSGTNAPILGLHTRTHQLYSANPMFMVK